MESLYDLPSGDQVRVIDTTTAGRSLGLVLQVFREGGTEPLFFGDQLRPEGVVISFDQWAEYEALKQEAAFEKRVVDTTRQRLASAAPEDYVPFEDMAREYGWDLDDDDDGRSDSGPGGHRP